MKHLKFTTLIVAILLSAPVVRSQSFSIGGYTNHNSSNFDITSKNVMPFYSGQAMEVITYSDLDIDTLNLFHDYQRQHTSFGLQGFYEFRKKETSRISFGLGFGLGLSSHEHTRDAYYDGTTYHEWSGAQFRANSDGCDWNIKIKAVSTFHYTPKLSLKGVLNSNLFIYSTSKISDYIVYDSEEYEESYQYNSKILSTSFDVLVNYTIKELNLFVGPRIYYDYEWTRYSIWKLDIDDDVEYEDIIRNTYQGRSVFMFAGGVNYVINQKLGIGLQIAKGTESFHVCGQINYYIINSK